MKVGMINIRFVSDQALAQLKRSTDTAWHDQLYSRAAVISEKKDAMRLAHQQEQLNVRRVPLHVHPVSTAYR